MTILYRTAVWKKSEQRMTGFGSNFSHCIGEAPQSSTDLAANGCLWTNSPDPFWSPITLRLEVLLHQATKPVTHTAFVTTETIFRETPTYSKLTCDACTQVLAPSAFPLGDRQGEP